jgi:hypothetical protein
MQVLVHTPTHLLLLPLLLLLLLPVACLTGHQGLG